MHKDFDAWNETKKEIHGRTHAPFYHVREIWWCSFGVNVGSEQDGSGNEYRRPAIILRGFGPQTCLVVPLTTSKNIHLLRPSVGLIDGKEAHALLSQIRVIDTKRLVRKIGYLPKERFETLRKAARGML